MDRQQKRKEKDKKEEIVKEFEKIELKYRIRNLRRKRSEEEKLEQNSKAKEGMRDLREKGRMIRYKERGQTNLSEKADLKYFMRKSKQHKDLAEKLRPDIVKLINTKQRRDMEMLRQENEKEKSNESEENKDWTPPTEGELEIVRYEEERWGEEIRKERKEKAAFNRKKKLQKLRKAMKKPIIPPPQPSELSEYEKLRNRNIEKIKQAMKASGFFDDLHQYKKDIGFLK